MILKIAEDFTKCSILRSAEDSMGFSRYSKK